MWTRWRQARLPRQVQAELELARGERVIAHAAAAEGYVVATNHALHLPGRGRIGWEAIEHAEWSAGGLHVRETVPLGEPAREHNLRVPEPGSLPEVIRERVQSTIMISQYARLEDKRGVRVIGRRRPDSDQISWVLLFDAGLDPQDPELRARAESLLAEVRAQTGL